LSGYLSTAGEWDIFSAQWRIALADPPSINYFHMVDAEALRQEFKGWNPEARDAKVTRLAKVITSNVRWEISCMLPRALHDSLIGGSAPAPRFENPYYVCYMTLISILSSHRELLGIGSQGVDLVFDRQAKIKGLVTQLHSEVQNIPRIGSALGSIEFQDDKEALPLQAADFIAWGLRRFCATHEVRHGLEQVVNVPNVRIQPTAEMLHSLAQEFQDQRG
jgi:hypothetical protein